MLSKTYRCHPTPSSAAAATYRSAADRRPLAPICLAIAWSLCLADWLPARQPTAADGEEPSTASGGLIGLSVVPHQQLSTLRYRRPPEPVLAAHVQLMLRGVSQPPTFNGKSPDELLAGNEWAWHDLVDLPPHIPSSALVVWQFNGRTADWGVDRQFTLQAEDLPATQVRIDAPEQTISAITFLADANQVQPNRMLAYVENRSDHPLQIEGCRIWLPDAATDHHHRILWPQPIQPVHLTVEGADKGCVDLRFEPLPLTYAAVELLTDQGSLWSHLRIKAEAFDISGGWIGDHLTDEAYLRLLKSLHINTGHIGQVPGYTDNPTLYDAYPIKLFNQLSPIEEHDQDAWLPKIHGVEFLGEPQYGGGTPVPPQKVLEALLPYRSSRLPTTLTHSEERIWRWYAGLSDYPHYDAYRVVAPAADAWTQYERWGPGVRLRWGAPLETIGDLSRNLRDLNRPRPCAYWSQGPHHNWKGWLDGRPRRSPTPEELRSQAMHALATRITSLYWFNLSLKSLMAFPDTWPAIQRLGVEMRMLAPIYLTGDAYRFERRLDASGAPDWDLHSIISPDAALLFALDTAYEVDPKQKVFRFGPPRQLDAVFALPNPLRSPTQVLRVDASGFQPVSWNKVDAGVRIQDTISQDAIYLVVTDAGLIERLEARRQHALADQQRYAIDYDELAERYPQLIAAP
jgi:hypothetical protein